MKLISGWCGRVNWIQTDTECLVKNIMFQDLLLTRLTAVSVELNTQSHHDGALAKTITKGVRSCALILLVALPSLWV